MSLPNNISWKDDGRIVGLFNPFHGHIQTGVVTIGPTSVEWTQTAISNEGAGLSWGPGAATIDAIDGNGDTITTELDNRYPGAAPYTELSYGNPVEVTGDIDFTICGNLTSLEFRLLETVGGFVDANTSADLLSFKVNLLETVGGDFNFADCLSLVTFEVDALQSVGGDFSFAGCASLPSLSFPSFVTITGNTLVYDCTLLTSFSAPSWVPTDGTQIDFTNGALDAASVNHILARCIAGGLTTAMIDLSGGTNAAPTGQGIIDAAALVTAGCTVTTN